MNLGQVLPIASDGLQIVQNLVETLDLQPHAAGGNDWH